MRMSIVEQLRAAGETLSPAVEAALRALEQQVRDLTARVSELEARLQQNSQNSSRPPSSDPPSVKRRAKKPTGRKRGAQPGHRGHHRKLLDPARVDEVVEHRPEACRHCGESLAGAVETKRRQRHQVVDLPPLRARVTEHQRLCLRCPRCQRLTRAVLPAAVGRRSFGPGLSALVVMLTGRYRLSRRETGEVLGELLDVPAPSLGSTQSLAEEASAALAASHAEVRRAVQASASACVDETGWKLRGRFHWLWTAVTAQATLFHLGPSRGSAELMRMLEPGYAGLVTSDRWSAYRICARRQLCWAHLKRNFEALGLRGAEGAHFSRRGLALCSRVFKTMQPVREGRAPREEIGSRMQKTQARLRRLLQRGETSEERRIAGFSRQLLGLWPFLWSFVDQPIEPTNNAAERALRKAVLWRKGCFGSQSEEGLRFVERILTVTATCQQHSRSVLRFLTDSFAARRALQEPPSLLPPG
jgi:transposase